MKMNNIYKIDKNGCFSELAETLTDEQLEYFKKGMDQSKVYYAEHKEYIKNLTGFYYCVISYEPKIIFAVAKKDEDNWTEIATYKTKGAANKRIANELYLYNSNIELRNSLKVVSRYQTINEVI